MGPPFWQNRTFWVIAILVLLLMSLNWIVNTYTEWLWFNEVRYQQVWLRQWGVELGSFAVAFVAATAVLLGSWHIARRRASKATPNFYPQILGLPGIGWLITGAGLFVAFGFGSSAAAQWDTLLQYVFRVPYGTSDPIFNQDISFYLFELPVYNFLQGWFVSLLFMTLLGTAAIYAINFLPDIQRGKWRPQESPVFRQHVALLGALLLAGWAVGYWLDIFELLFSRQGIVVGATYTDLNANLLALRAQLFLMAALAVAVALNIFQLNLRPAIAIGGLWLAASFLLGGLYPGLLQRYAVEPNEIVRESPYIEYNIEFTRLAFGLDTIETQQFGVPKPLTRQTLEDNATTLENVRLWDYRPLRDTYEQLQTLRTYYQFGEIDIDRYEIDDEIQQVMLGARELDKSALPSSSWVNRNLEFTHGYGIVMNPVNKFTEDGQPEFYIQDLPPRSVIDLEITRPEVYYGEMTTDAVFVGSAREEFDYPSGTENVYSSYAGKGGVPLDSYLKRLAFSFRLGDINVLLSDEINNQTRVQFHREIRGRVLQIAPFLTLDSDPYIVVADGRLVWMMDAYTLSDNFPYATPINRDQSRLRRPFNYIRNAVKITVDAYDGSVNFYIADTDDVLIRTYDRAFPGLFRSLDELPETLQSHIRYPEDLFRIQTRQLLTYHMEDVRVFYNKEDLWDIPGEIFEGAEQPMEPYYVTMKLPGEERIEYLLIQPYVPSGKDNMVAWIAARNDLPHYGELLVYELPKQELVFGPIQVENRIDQEPSISEQFSLWDQLGSRVIRGNLLVFPVNQSFLYVEPVYLQADTRGLPELKRVIVASDTRIAMGNTMEEALAQLFMKEPTAVTAPPPETDAATDGETITAPLDATMEELIQSANTHFEAAEAAQRAGDWATYGRELDALQQDLQRMTELSQ